MIDQVKNHPLYRKHNIDSAMSTLWEFYKARFIPLFLISLVFSGATQFSTFFIDFSDIKSTQDPMEALQKLKEFIWPMIAVSVITLVFSTILHYYILHKPIDPSCNIFKCTARSFRYLVPYLIIVIITVFVSAIAMLLGLFVLIIGIFFAMLYVGMVSMFILPVMMTEEAGIDTTIARTVKLAHANFWPNIGWTAVFIILYLVISMVLSGIVLLPFAGSFIRTMINPEDASSLMDMTRNPIFIILSSAVNALTQPLIPVFAFILYFNGKAREDEATLIGHGSDQEYRVRVEDLYAKPRKDESDSI